MTSTGKGGGGMWLCGGGVTKFITFLGRHKYMTPNLQHTNFPLVIYAKSNYSTPLSFNKACESKRNSSLIIYRTDCSTLKLATNEFLFLHVRNTI